MEIGNLTLAENERILLRHTREEDADDLKELFDVPLNAEQTKMMIAHFASAFKEGREANLAIVDKGRNKVVGIISLYDIRQDNSLQIGYRVREEERNKRYATDAVKLLSPLLLETYGAEYIRATAHTDNYPSVGVLTNSGYQLVAQEKSVCLFMYDQACAAKMKQRA